LSVSKQVDDDDEDNETSIKPLIDRHSRLLSSLSNDTDIDDLYRAWSVNVTSTLIPEHSLISVRSNRWPGAFTVGDRQHFRNIYIGWGMKNFNENYQIDRIHGLPKHEYVNVMIEHDDPTVDEENAVFDASIFFSPDENDDQ
jgi:hypothetical protein